METALPGRVRWLYIDFNSYFASVEQQLRPELRGRPVAVVPVAAHTTCCIASSYEAKKFGIRTGTDVAEARRLCPEIQFVVARQKVYAEFHHRFRDVIGRCLPVTHIRSIDEVACRLDEGASMPDRAIALTKQIKSSLADGIGEHLKCSIGIAPNELLAKIASDAQKPDGLYLLRLEDMEDYLTSLSLRDIPGIGERMELRLRQHGIQTMKQFLSLSPKQMRSIWGSLEGERLWYRLHGYNFELPMTAQSTIGHQHVLPPHLRTAESAGAVAQKLLCRAAERMRRQHLWAKGLSLYLSFTPGREKLVWECHTRIAEAQDNFVLIEILKRMWNDCPAGKPTFVGVTLYDLVPEEQHSGWLFAEDESRSLVCKSLEEALGSVSAKIYPASVHAVRDAAPPQIAFGSIPEF